MPPFGFPVCCLLFILDSCGKSWMVQSASGGSTSGLYLRILVAAWPRILYTAMEAARCIVLAGSGSVEAAQL